MSGGTTFLSSASSLSKTDERVNVSNFNNRMGSNEAVFRVRKAVKDHDDNDSHDDDDHDDALMKSL
jgi:hypothetical protein